MECSDAHSADFYGDLDEYMMEGSYQVDSDEEDELGRFGVLSLHRLPIAPDPPRRDRDTAKYMFQLSGANRIFFVSVSSDPSKLRGG